MLLADCCIEFKFQPLTGKGIFLSCFELYSGFFHLDELNLGDNNEAASNNAAAFFIEVSCNFSNLLDYQLLRYIAEHDGVNTLRQIAYVYSQSLNAGFEVERSYPSAVDVENLKQSVLLQCLELQGYEVLRRVGIHCELPCIHLLQRRRTACDEYCHECSIARNGYRSRVFRIAVVPTGELVTLVRCCGHDFLIATLSRTYGNATKGCIIKL